MSPSLMHLVTDLGDDAVTAAIAIAITAYLFATKQKHAALTMALSFVLSIALLALGKMALYSGCIKNGFDLRSPSGHSALSLVVYGLFAAFVSSSLSGWRRTIPFLVAVPLIAAISFSRVGLGLHTAPDVVIGLALGLVVSAGLWWFLMRKDTILYAWINLPLVVLAAFALVYGAHLSAEEIISAIAHYFQRREICL